MDTAKILIDEGAVSCSLDSSGYSALSVLIDRLPKLALEALSQLHKRDVISMNDYYYLQHLEASRQKIETKSARTALETAVVTRKYEVVTHPVMQRLIYNKWILYGRLSTTYDLLFHAAFGILWTSVSIGTPQHGRDLYRPMEDHIWRVVIGLLILLLTVYDIGRLFYGTFCTIFLDYIAGYDSKESLGKKHAEEIMLLYCSYLIFSTISFVLFSFECPNNSTVLIITIIVSYYVVATRKLQRSKKNWIEWRINELENDLKYCHPRWPQERKYIEYEMKRVKSLPMYNELGAWFYLDWVILILIIASIITHFVFFYDESIATRYLYTRVISVMNLLVWLRLLKYVRPFPGLGTLVIILGETSGDFVNWAFLFFLLLIPFSAAFMINFGPLSVHSVHGFHEVGEILYTVFQIAVGDNFNMEGIVEADPVMARILVVLYVTAVTIVTLNLLIALLSDTFSRVYSNAVANTIMQRALKVVDAERMLSKKKKLQYREFMKTNCSPEVLRMSFDGRRVESPSEIAETEIATEVQIMKGVLDDRFSKVYGEKTCDFDAILKQVTVVRNKQDDLTNDIMAVKKLVNKLTGKVRC